MEAIEFAKGKGLPFFVFGGGSNILFRDDGYNGVAIKSQISNIKYQNLSIVAGSGVLLSQLIIKSIDAGLSGLEWGIGIPGTIGGCVAGNCGAYGHDVSESIEFVYAMDEKGVVKKYSKEECEFAYRESRFKNPPAGKREIILEVELKLKKGDRKKSEKEIKEILTNRKGKIPPYPSIGSIFKNPKPLVARKLIEECGLAGTKVGGAQISELHANFIVNLGGAKAEDVLALIKLCKEKVKDKFKIELEEEIVVV